MLAPTIMTAARSRGWKMGSADQPSRNSVSAFAVPELPRRYLQAADTCVSWLLPYRKCGSGIV